MYWHYVVSLYCTVCASTYSNSCWQSSWCTKNSVASTYWTGYNLFTHAQSYCKVFQRFLVNWKRLVTSILANSSKLVIFESIKQNSFQGIEMHSNKNWSQPLEAYDSIALIRSVSTRNFAVYFCGAFVNFKTCIFSTYCNVKSGNSFCLLISPLNTQAKIVGVVMANEKDLKKSICSCQLYLLGSCHQYECLIIKVISIMIIL